jgi:hypothetical protein
MADDDYGTDISEDEAFATAKANGADTDNQQTNSDAPKGDTGGEMHTDPNDSTSPIPPEEEGRGEGDVADVTQPYTPEERMQHYMDQTKAARDSVDKIQAVTQPMWEKYRNMLSQDQQMAEQGPPEDQKYPDPPSKQKQTWMGAITQLLSVAVPIAMMFGVKGNGFAKGAMMSAMGAFMKNYTAGKDQAAKEDWTQWKEQVQAIHESNTERHQIYKDILSNKRLALDDQFKMIRATGQEFLDPTMMKAGRTNDMKAVIKHLENQEKADKRFVAGAAKTAKILHPRDWQDYKQYMKDKYNIDPETDPVGADKKMKYTDWKETESTQSERKQTEKAEAEKAKTPSPEDTRKTLFGDE